MEHRVKSIRTFIGAKDFGISRSFYRDLGFEEHVIDHKMCYFKTGEFGFYLQDYYATEWVNNSMIFLEVDDTRRYYNELLALDLPAKYAGVKLVPIREEHWGRECFLIDPAGVLWHFGEFNPL